MTLYECSNCFHVQRRGGNCELCGINKPMVEVPSPAEIKERAALEQMNWTEREEQRHCCGAYRTQPYQFPEQGSRDGRRYRSAEKGG